MPLRVFSLTRQAIRYCEPMRVNAPAAKPLLNHAHWCMIWPTTYTVDALNRAAQTQYIDNTRVTNSWDPAGQPFVNADITGIYSYVWDLDGRLSSTVVPTGIALTNTLDSVGNRMALADSFGRTTYSWDLQSRLVGMLNPINEQTTIQWDPLNREQHRVLANGGTVSHTFDAAGREILLENRNASGIGQAIFTNSYDPLSNRLSVIELDNTRVSYSYDSSSQLISEARSGSFAYNRSYVWDALGNRLQQYDSGVLTQRTFNAANAMLTIVPASGSPTTQVFDANGNLTLSTTGSAVTTNTWSPSNQLLSQISPTVNEQYLYSQDGMRQQKINSSGTTQFTLDGQNVLLETTSAGVLQARNTQYPNDYGDLISQNRSSASSFYGFDTQQSTRILVSAGGLITDSLSFKAFGEELQGGSGTVNPFWFGGQVGYFRDLPGVMNLGHRKLIAANGVFLNRDPIGLAGVDINLFRYVANEPVSSADPSGLCSLPPAVSWLLSGLPVPPPPPPLALCNSVRGELQWSFDPPELKEVFDWLGIKQTPALTARLRYEDKVCKRQCSCGERLDKSDNVQWYAQVEWEFPTPCIVPPLLIYLEGLINRVFDCSWRLKGQLGGYAKYQEDSCKDCCSIDAGFNLQLAAAYRMQLRNSIFGRCKAYVEGEIGIEGQLYADYDLCTGQSTDKGRICAFGRISAVINCLRVRGSGVLIELNTCGKGIT